MKPIVLTMQAFGPFAGRQEIDFRVLGDKSFFLIHGATGSGKTTILDGICFALFGDSSGGERQARQMRSDHANLETLTEVIFDFELGDRRYRVRRVPEQLRKALKGDGEVMQQPVAELWQLHVDGETESVKPKTSGPSRVTDAVEKLLGFHSTQFRQVIMLPQGKFRDFLISPTSEREKILQTLFGTEIYKRIEDALRLASNKLAEESKKIRTQQQALLDQAAEKNLDDLAARQQRETQELAQRQGIESDATATANLAETRLTGGRAVALHFDEWDMAATELEGLSAAQPEWDLQRHRLSGARRAGTIAPYEAAVTDLGLQLEAEVSRGAKLAGELQKASEDRLNADDLLERQRGRAPELEAAIVEISKLGTLVQKVAMLSDAKNQHAVASRESGNADQALRVAQQTMDTATMSYQALTVRIQTLGLSAAGLEGQREACKRWTDDFGRVNRLTTLTRERDATAKLVVSCQATLAAAQGGLAGMQARHASTLQLWIAGQAARLAAELVDGEPCSVCGSSEHPAPAHRDGVLVPDAMLKASEAAVTTADESVRQAESLLAAQLQGLHVLEAQIADVRGVLGSAGELPPAEIRQQLLAAQSALKQAEADAEELKSSQASLPKLEANTANADDKLKAAQGIAQQAQTKLQQLVGTLQVREAEVPAHLADVGSLRAAILGKETERDALTRAFDSSAAAASRAAIVLVEAETKEGASRLRRQELAQTQAEKTTDLLQRLEAGGFADLAAFRSAQLGDAEVLALEADISAFDTKLGGARERQRRAVNGVDGFARPDVAALLAEHQNAKAAHLAASNAVRDSMGALAGTTGFVESLKKLMESQELLQARYGVVNRVSAVASGDNTLKLSLQRYVLATLFQEVVVATNLRMGVMSRGRYEMRRKEEAGDMRAAGGLDLEIFDQYTGATRAVSTLSGGESFLAALALALGLSDVVQGYSGGTRLDAIFIDEGFGSLDPEALDHAIRALKDLQQTGRLVGIISHVAELKECIDARLELTSSQSGSHAKFVV